MADRADRPPTHKAPATSPKSDAAGPVPLHHRRALGHEDAGSDNPNGAGKPSTVSTIANGGRKGW